MGNRVIVAHNAAFDRRLLEAEFRRAHCFNALGRNAVRCTMWRSQEDAGGVRLGSRLELVAESLGVRGRGSRRPERRADRLRDRLRLLHARQRQREQPNLAACRGRQSGFLAGKARRPSQQRRALRESENALHDQAGQNRRKEKRPRHQVQRVRGLAVAANKLHEQ